MRTSKTIVPIMILTSLLVASCAAEPMAAPVPPDPKHPSPAPSQGTSQETRSEDIVLRISTSFGDILIKLDRDLPREVSSDLLENARSGVYDETVIHFVHELTISGGSRIDKDLTPNLRARSLRLPPGDARSKRFPRGVIFVYPPPDEVVCPKGPVRAASGRPSAIGSLACPSVNTLQITRKELEVSGGCQKVGEVIQGMDVVDRIGTLEAKVYPEWKNYRVPLNPPVIETIRRVYVEDGVKTPAQLIEGYVQDKINQWQKKGEFEKTADYTERIKQRPEKIHALTEEAIAFYRNRLRDGTSIKRWILDEYDADRETFKIGIPELGHVILPLPISKAPTFKKTWPEMQVKDLDIIVQGGKWVVSSMVLMPPGGNESYTYDSNARTGYDPQSQFSFIFEPVQVPSDVTQGGNVVTTAVAKFDDYDVDKRLPRTTTTNPEAVAVVIGNNRYQHTKPVEFAINDALAVKKYLVEVMGYKDGNILLLTNATKGDFEGMFGTSGNPQGKLYNTLTPGKSDVFVYYAGHGAPGLKDKRGYFVPIESDPNYVELQGYPLDTFYANLGKLPVRSLTVLLDACFSGADLFENMSPVTIELAARSSLQNGVVLASSTGGQVSTWYNDKRHGMMTYFFLKGIHSRGADANKDGQVTLRELYAYLSDKSEGVPYWARRIYGVEQDPTVSGSDLDRVLVRY